MEKSVILISIIVASAIALMACPRPQSTDNAAIPLPAYTVAAAPDSVAPSADNARYERLTDEDYKKDFIDFLHRFRLSNDLFFLR